MDDKPADNNSDNMPETKEPTTETSLSAVDLSKETTTDTVPETPRTTPFTLPIQPPPSSKKPLILGIIAAIVVLCAVGAAVFFLLQPKPVQQTPVASVSPTPTPVVEYASAETLIKDVSSHLEGTAATIAKSDATSGSLASGQVVYGTPYYQVSGKEFKTVPLKSFGAAVTGQTDVTESDYKKITTFLTEHKFEEVSATTGKPGETTVASGVYVSDKIACLVGHIDLTETAVKANVASIGCADVSSYAEAATAVQPFYDAYVASDMAKEHPEYTKDLSMGAPTIKDGVEGYKNAMLTIGSGVALYYQEPGKDWMFFMGTQQQPTCSVYNTDILKKAFSGRTCLDTVTGEATVIKV